MVCGVNVACGGKWGALGKWERVGKMGAAPGSSQGEGKGKFINPHLIRGRGWDRGGNGREGEWQQFSRGNNEAKWERSL